VTATLTGVVRLVRLVVADAHEGPTWFADEDALHGTPTDLGEVFRRTGTDVDPTTAEARAAGAATAAG
jgi:hypothetical protein